MNTLNILAHDARLSSTRLLAKLALAGLLVLSALATIGCGNEAFQQASDAVSTPVPTHLCTDCSGGGGLINSAPLSPNDMSNAPVVHLP